MVRKRWFALVAGALALASSAQASDTLLLGGTRANTDTVTLDLRGDAGSGADTELTRFYRGGWGGGWGRGGWGGWGGSRVYVNVGFGRGWHGHRGWYGGGYGGGWYGGYHRHYRPYYASYWGGGYSYPSYYYSSYSYPVYSYPSYYYSAPSYYYPCSDSSPVMPYATVATSPATIYTLPGSTVTTTPSTIVPSTVPSTVTPPAGDGTYRYDGGPVAPMPAPMEFPATPMREPRLTLPKEGRFVSLPTATPQVAYPAYGESPTTTRRADADTRLVSTPVATPRVAYPAYGDASRR